MAKQPAKKQEPTVAPPYKEPKQPRARSAKTGRFVSIWYAVWHPATTIVERRKKK